MSGDGSTANYASALYGRSLQQHQHGTLGSEGGGGMPIVLRSHQVRFQRHLRPSEEVRTYVGLHRTGRVN